MNPNYSIQQLPADTPIPYNLLLLADETKEAIDHYIFDCTIFALVNEKSGERVGIMAIKSLNQDTLELKNIAIATAQQAQGLGSYMLSFLITYAQEQQVQQVWVGTADTGYLQHRFYMRNGFEMDHIRHNFFIDNYPDSHYRAGFANETYAVFFIPFNNTYKLRKAWTLIFNIYTYL